MVAHPTSAPGSLDAVLTEPDPAVRLQRLSEYIQRGEQQLTRAREARAEVTRQLRDAGTSWPRIVALAGVSDTYLRREAKQQ